MRQAVNYQLCRDAKSVIKGFVQAIYLFTAEHAVTAPFAEPVSHGRASPALEVDPDLQDHFHAQS